MTRDAFDVAIIGAGIGGSMLAAILARQGVRTVILDRAPHPRFAIGESTIPETTAMLRVVAARHGVPEIAQIADFRQLCAAVGPSSGVKRSFSYAWHAPGEKHRGEHSHMFPTWGPPFGPDLHYFRQDVDAWLFHAALRHGAEMRVPADVKQVRFGDDGVVIELGGGHEIAARFVVDGAGFGSPLVRQLGLKASVDGMRTDSRTAFTHMIGVPAYDTLGPSPAEHGLPYAFNDGTLHHIFDGGWIWVIPFGNHVGATNPLISVGVCLDNRRWPDAGLGPAETFADVIARFPSVAAHFKDARAARPWVAARRMQQLTTQAFGDRWCLLPHSAGFIDPLFSSGLSLTAWVLNRLPDKLLAALGEDRFDRARFAGIEADLSAQMTYYDALVARGYAAFRDPAAWDAWFRIWVLAGAYGLSGTQVVAGATRMMGPKAYGMFEAPPYNRVQALNFEPMASLYAEAGACLDRFEAGETTAAEAQDAIIGLIEQSGLGPVPWRLTDRSKRYPTTFTLPNLIEYMQWGRTASPPSVRNTYFGGGKGDASAWFQWVSTMLLDELQRQGQAASARSVDYLRESLQPLPWRGGHTP